MIKLSELLLDVDLDTLEYISENIVYNPNTPYKVDDNQKTIPFEIGEYKFKITIKLYDCEGDGKKVASVKFILLNNPREPKREDYDDMVSYQNALTKSRIGLTGTGNAFEIFNKVNSITFDYCIKNDVTYIHFTAEEPKRQKIYRKILSKLLTQYKIPCQSLNYNPDNNQKIDDNKEFWLKKIG